MGSLVRFERKSYPNHADPLSGFGGSKKEIVAFIASPLDGRIHLLPHNDEQIEPHYFTGYLDKILELSYSFTSKNR